MNQLGFGYMLKQLVGNEDTVKNFQEAQGKEIKELSLGEDDALHFRFTDGSGIKIYDDGQSCCEHRYMTTDDDLSFYVGSTFLDAEIKDAPNEVDEMLDVHEVQFLEIKTSKGSFTMKSHNEHNGYYGGIWMVIEREE